MSGNKATFLALAAAHDDLARLYRDLASDNHTAPTTTTTTTADAPAAKPTSLKFVHGNSSKQKATSASDSAVAVVTEKPAKKKPVTKAELQPLKAACPGNVITGEPCDGTSKLQAASAVLHEHKRHILCANCHPRAVKARKALRKTAGPKKRKVAEQNAAAGEDNEHDEQQQQQEEEEEEEDAPVGMMPDDDE